METRNQYFNLQSINYSAQRERECFYPAPFGRGKIRSGWKQEETRILDKRCGVYLSEKKSASDNSSFQFVKNGNPLQFFVADFLLFKSSQQYVGGIKVEKINKLKLIN